MESMKKIGIVICCVLGLLVAVKIAWSIAYPSGTFRYKMTVTVETPEGDRTGYAVREVAMHREPNIFPEAGGAGARLIRGEAVAVDLGERGVVFALMRGAGIDGVDYGDRVAYWAFPCPYNPAPLSKECIRYYTSQKSSRDVMLKPGQYPMFVRFRDPDDPKTVESLFELSWDGRYPVTYSIKSNRFEEAFGEGVKLKEVTMQITDEEVTWGVNKRLPWLLEYRNKMFDGQRYNKRGADFPLANSISAGSFTVGGNR